jgi:protein TonB
VIDGQAVCRAGSREWFGDGLFADGNTRDLRPACASSIALHAGCLIGLFALVGSQVPSTIPARVSEPLRMPAFVAVIAGGGGAGATQSTNPPLLTPASEQQKRPPAQKRVAELTRTQPVPTPDLQAATIAPEVVPEGEQHHETAESDSRNVEGTSAGATAGAESGSADGGGSGGGTNRGGEGGGAAAIPAEHGPYRLGEGIEPPRKIKDVRPLYPTGALAMRALGTVVIEAIIGVDGKVREARIVSSIPELDQAALDAVRQWEFTPSRLNGVAVAVIVTVLVRFSLY